LPGNAFEQGFILGWPEKADGTAVLEDGSSCPYLKISDELIIAQTDFPGHTTIGRAFLLGRLTNDNRLPASNVAFAFPGDSILIGGIGRTDFACSTIEGMFDSLRRLPTIINPNTIICPTHDYNNDFATTLVAECRDNDFLGRILDPTVTMTLAEFVAEKPAIDAGISDETNSELVCGLIGATTGENDASIELHKNQLKDFFREHQHSLIIDVREPHEFAFEQDWSTLGFDAPPKNVPLTRLTNYLPKLMGLGEASSQDVIFLCRSGRRSGKAAEIARRIGIPNARHITGGIALNVEPKSAYDALAEQGYVI
jgi:cysteine desulfurase